MRAPLPADAFPRMIVTPRLRLRRPERAEEAMYARYASEAYRTRGKPLTDVQARDLATFTVDHWGPLRVRLPHRRCRAEWTAAGRCGSRRFQVRQCVAGPLGRILRRHRIRVFRRPRRTRSGLRHGSCAGGIVRGVRRVRSSADSSALQPRQSEVCGGLAALRHDREAADGYGAPLRTRTPRLGKPHKRVMQIDALGKLAVLAPDFCGAGSREFRNRSMAIAAE